MLAPIKGIKVLAQKIKNWYKAANDLFSTAV